MKRKRERQSHKKDHKLIGQDVWYRGKVWRVVSAHATDSQGQAWLTLKRGFGMEALAKSYELTPAFN